MSGAPQFPTPDWYGAQPLRPGGAAHKAGLTMEQRIEALERGALGRPGPGVVDGCTITSDIASQGGVRWENRGIVSSLPGSPVDGQECYYQSAAMVTNGIGPWHLKYRSGSASAYKWEVVAAIPLYSEKLAAETTTTGVYAAFASPPTVTTPLAGDYYIDQGAQYIGNGSTGQNSWLSFAIGGAAALDQNGTVMQGIGAGITLVPAARRVRINGFAASTAVAERVRTTGGSTGYYSHRWITMTPIRVG